MSRESLLTGLAILILTVVGFFHFPGHTWLQSDTQIYVAILEHIWDPSVLTSDLVATRPHVSYTIYDEVAIGLRKLTGLSFRDILMGEQFVFRWCALWGVFLIVRALGFAVSHALLVTSCFALGAVINGPSVLLFEYEPVPRAFAVSLIFLSAGLAAHRDWLWSGVAGALAFLFHPPTAFPLWAVAGLFWLVLHRRKEPLRILVPAAISMGVLFVLSRTQAGERETQNFFSRIGPPLESLQRMRGAYNWISQWPSDWFWQYPLLMVFAYVAWRRFRPVMTAPLEWLSLGLPLCGMASAGVSWLLLDVAKWSLIPQAQPARAVLFITAFAIILGACAGIQAAGARRWWEALAWFVLVYALPANGRVAQLFDLGNEMSRTRLAVVLALAGISTFAAWGGRVSWWRAGLAAAAPFLLLPTAGKVRNYPSLHTPALAELSSWAAAHSPKSAVFVFAGDGHDLAPGIFRAEALRSIYVDWKGGGQVNLLPSLGFEWWTRWQRLRQGDWRPGDESRFAGYGITHYVLPVTVEQPAGATPLFRNSRYAVYSTER